MRCASAQHLCADECDDLRHTGIPVIKVNDFIRAIFINNGKIHTLQKKGHNLKETIIHTLTFE